MNNGWHKVRLSEVLVPVNRNEKVVASKEYRLLGVRLDGRGPFLRETVTGAETSAKSLARVVKGDFIYSRLFAWRGAFGIIDPELDGCYVSSEFPTFNVKPDQLDIQFLNLWFYLPSTLAAVVECCTGSTPLTRNRFKEEFFLALHIPLPPHGEQRQIVARIDSITSQIAAINQLRVEQQKDIGRALLSAFELALRGAPRRPMSEVAPLVRRPIEIDMASSYPELGIRSFGKGTFHKPSLSGADVGTKRIFKINPGDLLFSNVFAWEGAIAVARPDDSGRVGSHRFISCVPNPEIATSQFLCFYFLTEEGLSKIRAASPGGALRNRTLGLSALNQISVPTPTLERQRSFDELQEKVKRLRIEHSDVATELDAMLPSIVDKVFQDSRK
jgi:type I restriction enzyme, S subunit